MGGGGKERIERKERTGNGGIKRRSKEKERRKVNLRKGKRRTERKC